MYRCDHVYAQNIGKGTVFLYSRTNHYAKNIQYLWFNRKTEDKYGDRKDTAPPRKIQIINDKIQINKFFLLKLLFANTSFNKR